MKLPYRGNTGAGTYFITASSYQKQSLLQSSRMAGLLIEVLYSYREQKKFLLHEFVVMPNHIHLLITPADNTTLERAIQFIKGGFSFRVKKELGYVGEIWEKSFYDHRVRDGQEFQRFRAYIHQNPVKRGLIASASGFPYSSANPRYQLDEVPQRLKPFSNPAA